MEVWFWKKVRCRERAGKSQGCMKLMCFTFFPVAFFSDQKWMNNQKKTIPLKRDTQVKILLKKMVKLDKSNWYGIWILWFHGIWGVPNFGIPERHRNWVGRWAQSGLLGKDLCPHSTTTPCRHAGVFPPLSCSLQSWPHLTHLLCASQSPDFQPSVLCNKILPLE